MRRPFLAALIAGALLLAACTQPPPQAVRSPAPTLGTPAPSPSPSPSPSPVPPPPPVFSTDRAMAHVRVLAGDIGPRPLGSDGEAAATAYLESVLAAAGYEVIRQPVARPGGGTSFNVIGRARGVDYGAGYLVVGAHFDTVIAGPGANDNGSGTAVVLALAEAFARRPVPVEFVGFTGEEQQPQGVHHVGSRSYVDGLADPPPVTAMLSIDMVGNGPTLLVGRYAGFPADLQQEVTGVSESLGVPTGQVARGDLSDHAPFARRGIPAAWLWSGDHPTLHTPQDTVEVVQADAVERAGRVALEWLRRRTGL